ncbi:MAG: hypothetical protein KER_03056 [Kerstersia gyiorum]|uniref:hypothetical protein n=1 Tax=Kerstersia gyiorum TaxID=206506 RepID=UPI0030D5780C
MFDYDFSGLTDLQRWLILYQGWRTGQRYPDGSLWPQPGKRTVKKLIDRGLMTAHEVQERSGGLAFSVIEYRVPLHVHAAYCFSCR